MIAIALALSFRKRIIQTHTPEGFSIVALGLPVLGAMLFICGLTIVEWASSTDPPGTVLQSLSLLVALALGTLVLFPITTFYVTIPAGLLSVFVLRKIGRLLWPEVAQERRMDTI